MNKVINPLTADLNPICHLLELLGTHHILHVSGLRVNFLEVSLCLIDHVNCPCYKVNSTGVMHLTDST